MPEKIEYTSLPPDPKLYQDGKFESNTYKKAQEYVAWWGKEIISPETRNKKMMALKMIALKKREWEENAKERRDADNEITQFTWTPIAKNTFEPIQIDEWGFSISGTWDKVNDLFRGKYKSPTGESFRWTARMTASSQFPKPIQWILQDRTGTTWTWSFDPTNNKLRKWWVIQYADGERIILSEDWVIPIAWALSQPSQDRESPPPVLVARSSPRNTSRTHVTAPLWVQFTQAQIR